MRIKQGFICKKLWQQRRLLACIKVAIRVQRMPLKTTLKSGTVMQSLHISYRV